MKDKSNIKIVYIVFLAVVIFFAVNIIGLVSLNKYEFDMTEDKVFTLSDGSKKILSGINEPIKLRFFFSNKALNGLPVIKSYGARIRGVLEKYVDDSDGLISLQVIDPESFTEDEDKAVSFGIKGVDIDQIGTKAYIGLAITNSIDDTKVIPFISLEKEKFLEYEITRAIYDLANPKRKVVGILSTEKLGSAPMLGIPGLGGSSWFVVQQIAQVFQVKDVDISTTKIPSDIDVLMVVQPRNLGEDTIYAIEQYVLSGGRAIFFADPNKGGGGTGNPNDRSFSRNINRIFNQWGINISPNTVVADRLAARKYDKGADQENQWKYVDNITWIALKGDNLNRDDIATSLLKTINLETAGIIKTLDDKQTTITPLFKTNKASTKIPVFQVRNSPDVNSMLRNFVSDNKEYTVAARITGNVKSAFSEKANKEDHIDASNEPINVVVVADMDILRDPLWSLTQDIKGYTVVTSIADNAAFVVNSIDHLTGSSDLINLRSKGETKRPFEKVDKLEKLAQERYLSKEKDLKDRLMKTEERLASLKKMAESQAGSRLAFKQQQHLEIKRFSDEAVQVRKDLRNVQSELRKDIDSLGSILKFINIWLMPLVITFLAIVIFYVRSKNSRSIKKVR